MPFTGLFCDSNFLMETFVSTTSFEWHQMEIEIGQIEKNYHVVDSIL